MFIKKQPPGVLRQYPANLSQQADVIGARDVMKSAGSERNIEDARS
jgi:hypothetical protein